MSRRRATLFVTLLSLAILPGAFQDLTLDLAYHRADLGAATLWPWRITLGEVPYRDFITPWPPLSLLLTAASFRVFGPSLWSAKLPLAILTALAVWVGYRWLRQLFARGAAIAGIAAMATLVPLLLRLPYAHAFTLCPALLCFQQLGRMRPGRTRLPALFAGLSCGLAIGFKHNVGVLLLVAVWSRIVVIDRELPRWVRVLAVVPVLGVLASLALRFPATPRAIAVTLMPAAILATAGAIASPSASVQVPWRRLAESLLLVTAGAVVATAPWMLWLAAEGALRAFLAQGAIVGGASSADWGRQYATILAPRELTREITLLLLGILFAALAASTSTVRRARGIFTLATVALAVFLVARYDAWGEEAALEHAPVALVLAAALGDRSTRSPFQAFVLAAFVATVGFPGLSINHAATGAAPAILIVVALAWSRGGASGRVAATCAVSVIVMCGWVEWRDALLVAGRPKALAWVEGQRGGTLTTDRAARSLAIDARALEAVAPAGAPMIAWPSQGLLNFLTARPSPTRLDYFWPGWADDAAEAKIAQAMDRDGPDLLALSVAESVWGASAMWKAHPRIAAVVKSRYVPVNRVGDLLILRRAGIVGPRLTGR